MKSKFERKGLRQLKARQNRGSGNQWDNKSDGVKNNFRIEMKETDKPDDDPNFRVTIKVWKKIWEEAVTRGQKPAMGIRVGSVQFGVVQPEGEAHAKQMTWEGASGYTVRQSFVRHMLGKTHVYAECTLLCPDTGRKFPIQIVSYDALKRITDGEEE